MLPAFLIALREGVEASLVVGIVLVYLTRTGRSQLARFAWYGVAVAAALSLAVAILLERWRISEDGFEGVMYLVAAAFVITMILWMNRVARHLKKEIEQKIETYVGRAGAAAGWGIFLFVFLMVLREGAELAIILRAVELSTEGLEIWIGTALGIGAAVAVGVFFFKGTLRVPLHRFFAATSVDPDSCGVSARAHRLARTERSAMDSRPVRRRWPSSGRSSGTTCFSSF